MEDLYVKILKVNHQSILSKAQNHNWFYKKGINISQFENSFIELFFDEDRGVKSIFKNNSLEDCILKNRERLINNYKLKEYNLADSNDEQTDLFIRTIEVYANTLEYKLCNNIFNKFLDIKIMKNFICILGIKRPKQLFKIAMNMNIVLYEMMKEYMVGLIEFYYENPGLQFPIIIAPQSMIFEPFLIYYKSSTNILTYNKDRNKIQYLSVVYKIISDRNLDLSEELKENIIDSLSKIKNKEKGELSAIAEEIRYKLYTYTGFKCPSHLIYVSKLNIIQAKALADYCIGKFFEENTDNNVLSLLFKGRNGVLTDEEAELDFYKKNEFVSAPIVIKFKQLGYVAYLYNFLYKRGKINHDHIWESIARHKCFKIRGEDGSLRYITNNDLASSKRYKKARIENKTKKRNRKLEHLDKFLNELIKR